MNSNRMRRLSLQNPFFLDYERLTKIFGVNVITTPTLLTFAQLQNFYLFQATERDWPTYFWCVLLSSLIPLLPLTQLSQVPHGRHSAPRRTPETF